MRAVTLALALVVLMSSSATAIDGIWNYSDQEKVLSHRINVARQNHGAKPFKWSYWLNVVAAKRSSSMKRLNYFAHAAPNGTGAADIMRNMGINWFDGGAENIAWLSTRSLTPRQVAIKFKNTWLGSYPHRQQMLSKKWTHAGVGITKRVRSDGVVIWWGTLIMSRRR